MSRLALRGGRRSTRLRTWASLPPSRNPWVFISLLANRRVMCGSWSFGMDKSWVRRQSKPSSTAASCSAPFPALPHVTSPAWAISHSSPAASLRATSKYRDTLRSRMSRFI